MRTALLLLLALLTAVHAAPAKRLIATGWDSPTPAQFREHVAAFEQWPFDGTTIKPVRQLASGKDADALNAFSTQHWEAREFTNTVALLRAAHPRTATDNFLMLYANPGDVDWFDDSGWKEVLEHWRLLAWTAKQGGLKGILFDAEPYTPPHQQFNYSTQPGSDRHSFADTAAKARERGRDIMRSVVKEFPDIHIFSFRLFCDLLPATANGGDVQGFLPFQTYGLIPAFLDGWFDVMPESVVITEGDENAYRYNSEAEFDRSFVDLRTRGLGLIAPEHSAKFRAQYRISHGIYLDAHANPPTSPWYIDPLGGTRAGRLQANVSAALRTADEYVWIYGETARWWPSGNEKYPLWPGKLAGADRALFIAKDPVAAARQRSNASALSENLVRNAGFDESAENRPKEWWFWQDQRSHGSPKHDPVTGASSKGAACISGAENGCFGQNLQVRPGEQYAVSVRTRQIGRGFVGATARWETAAGKWTAEARDVQLSVRMPDAEGWRECVGLVQVPPSAEQLVLLLVARGQVTDQDSAWFDDIRVVPMK